MQAAQQFTFGSYRFDPQAGQLWRGTQEVKLTLKAAAVLRCLVGRSGQVITKDELFRVVWPETVVSDAALTSCIQELRQALHDQARKPRYIEQCRVVKRPPVCHTWRSADDKPPSVCGVEPGGPDVGGSARSPTGAQS